MTASGKIQTYKLREEHPKVGGGLPLVDVERPLGTRTITIPIANHDNNQHSYNENVRIQNLWDGIELFAALLTM